MYDWLITLLPLVTSAGGTAIIAKVAVGVVKHLAKKNDDKVNALKEQNKRLEADNAALKEQLNVNARLLEDCLSERKIGTQEEQKRNATCENILSEIKKQVDMETTIRNEIRTLLEAKKE